MAVVMDFRNPVTGTDLSDRKRTYPAVNAPGAAECRTARIAVTATEMADRHKNRDRQIAMKNGSFR